MFIVEYCRIDNNKIAINHTAKYVFTKKNLAIDYLRFKGYTLEDGQYITDHNELIAVIKKVNLINN